MYIAKPEEEKNKKKIMDADSNCMKGTRWMRYWVALLQTSAVALKDTGVSGVNRILLVKAYFIVFW